MRDLTPRKDFLKEPAAQAFAEMSSTPAFRRALEVALNQFFENQLPTGNDQSAQVAHYALQGALEYSRILLNLTEPDFVPKPLNQNLKWPSKPPQNPPQPTAQK